MDEKNALKCIKLLKDYFATMDDKEIAHVRTPNLEVGSTKWLQYIFYSCLLDYGMKSKLYHANLIHTYQNYPQIFDPNYVVEHFDNNREELLQIMKSNIHPRYPNVALKKWLSLSKKLSSISLLETISSFQMIEELNHFIKEIGEYGQKTGGLLIRLIKESNSLSFREELTFIPLDRHDIEISYYNGITNSRDLTSKEIEELSSCLIRAGKKVGLNPTLVDKYLWEVGNSFCSKKDCNLCPLGRNCKKNI